jgi:protoporphyrinogen oxidase
MAQYSRLITTVKHYPTYSWKTSLEEIQEKFIKGLEVGEIFSYPGGYNRSHWEAIQKKFEEKGVIVGKYEFKIKRLKKDYPNVGIVLQKGEKRYEAPVEDAQTFDPNLIFKEKEIKQ